MPVKHQKVSNKVDSSDVTLIQPTDWNSDHISTDMGILYSSAPGTPITTLNSGGFGGNYFSVLEKVYQDPNAETYYFRPQIFTRARDYQFQITGNDVISSGVLTQITISPVPLGVNGTDINHFIRINDFSGVSETVQIQGGNAVAGETSGTLIIYATSLHMSGSYYIESATSGIQEAINSLPNNGGVVFLDSGTFNILGPVHIAKDNVHIMGTSGTLCYAAMAAPNLTSDAFLFGEQFVQTPHSGCRISNLTIESNDKNFSAAAITILEHSNFQANDIIIRNFNRGIDIFSFRTPAAFSTVLENLHIENLGDSGSGIRNDGNSGVTIRNANIFCNNSNADAIVLNHGNQIKVSESLGTAGRHGLSIRTSRGQGILININIDQCTFGGNNLSGVFMSPEFVDSKIIATKFSNCNISSNNEHGMLIIPLGDFNRHIQLLGIHGCEINNNKLDGISMSSGPSGKYLEISDNDICDNAANGLKENCGIFIGPDSDYIHIHGNTIACLNGTIINPTSPPVDRLYKAAIWIEDTDGVNISVHHNMMQMGSVYYQNGSQTDKALINKADSGAQDMEGNIASGSVSENAILEYPTIDNDYTLTIEMSNQIWIPVYVNTTIIKNIKGGYFGRVIHLYIAQPTPNITIETGGNIHHKNMPITATLDTILVMQYTPWLNGTWIITEITGA